MEIPSCAWLLSRGTIYIDLGIKRYTRADLHVSRIDDRISAIINFSLLRGITEDNRMTKITIRWSWDFVAIFCDAPSVQESVYYKQANDIQWCHGCTGIWRGEFPGARCLECWPAGEQRAVVACQGGSVSAKSPHGRWQVQDTVSKWPKHLWSNRLCSLNRRGLRSAWCCHQLWC